MKQPTPSLKSCLTDQFSLISSDNDEKQLNKHVRDLIGMMLSTRFRYTCAYTKCYLLINFNKLKFCYQMHVVAKITQLGEQFHQDIKSEFMRDFLALSMEYMNLCIVTTKREKIRIRKRMRSLRSNIFKLKIEDKNWNANSAIMLLHHFLIKTLVEAFKLSLK